MIQLNVDTNSLLGFSKLRPLPSDENEEQDNLLSTWKDFFWFIKNPNLNINLQINNEEDIISKYWNNLDDRMFDVMDCFFKWITIILILICTIIFSQLIL